MDVSIDKITDVFDKKNVDEATKEKWWLIAKMYSVYQIGLVIIYLLFKDTLPQLFKDYVRAASLIVAIGWVTLYFYVGPNEIEKFYRHKFPFIPRQLIYLIDITIHILPIFIVGLPESYISYSYTFAVILIWYIFVRPIVQKVYGILPIGITDLAFFVLGPIIVIVITILHYNTKTKNKSNKSI